MTRAAAISTKAVSAPSMVGAGGVAAVPWPQATPGAISMAINGSPMDTQARSGVRIDVFSPCGGVGFSEDEGPSLALRRFGTRDVPFLERCPSFVELRLDLAEHFTSRADPIVDPVHVGTQRGGPGRVFG